MRIRRLEGMVPHFWFLISGLAMGSPAAAGAPAPESKPLPPVVAEVDRIIRARFFDPNWSNRAVRFFDGFNAGIGFIF